MNSARLYAGRIQSLAILLIAIVAILAATLATPASAHEGRNVGDYNLVVGFLHEPAYDGQLNAVSLVVTRTADDSMERHHTESKEDDGDPPADTMKMESKIDVVTHGAIFISHGLDRMENFEFEVAEEFSGVEIPYHVHPGDQEGIIVVSAKQTLQGEDRSIMIMGDHLTPAKLEVNVGDTVVWMNHEIKNAVIMSGPSTSMTSEMTQMTGNQSPSATAAVEPAVDRVTGLASTLQVEVAHLPTSASRVMPLSERFDAPGHYLAEFIPTAPGDYRMRFFGSIEGDPIDESFESGPDTFDTVIASDAIQFPVVLESNREIQNAAQGALDSIQELETDLGTTSSTASISMIVGIIGISFGVIATVISILAITIARRRY